MTANVRARYRQPMATQADELVVGAIDMHCHHGPDPDRTRSVDAAEAVAEADALGMAAIVLKSHAYPTGPVAILMQKTVVRLRVFGGICCDFEVGGLNPAAVEVALRTGAKVVWMPTFSSVIDRRKLKLPGPGIPVIGERARVDHVELSRCCRRRPSSGTVIGDRIVLRRPGAQAESQRAHLSVRKGGLGM